MKKKTIKKETDNSKKSWNKLVDRFIIIKQTKKQLENIERYDLNSR